MLFVVFFQKGVVPEEEEAEGGESNKPKRKRKASVATSAVWVGGSSKTTF